MSNNKPAQLHARLKQPGLVTAPGVFDMVSLRLAASFGFDALYMPCFGAVASHMGLPDAGLATYSDMVGRVGSMANMARTPLVADGDTGYGGLLNVMHTVRGYEMAGACAIQLEDQEFPKKCGHTPGRRVIPMADMVRKIQVAVDEEACVRHRRALCRNSAALRVVTAGGRRPRCGYGRGRDGSSAA